MVFLHGLFGQGRNFTQAAKALVPDLRSVLVDLPNHGRSAWTEEADYVVVAEVVAGSIGADGAPLLYHGGSYGTPTATDYVI